MIKISAQKSYLDWDLNNALNNTFYGAVALTNFKKLMRSPFFMSFQVYKLIFITKCPKKVYTKKALNDFCKAILIFLNLCTF